MTYKQENQEQPRNATVVLMEGERNLKPRPEALVNWPTDRPPGGPLEQQDPDHNAPADQKVPSHASYKRRHHFYIKVAGSGDLIDELDEDPLSQPVLEWLAAQLNTDQTRLMINPPDVGSRGPKDAQLDVQLCAGFTTQGSAHFDPQGPDGPGVYAEVDVIPTWTDLVGALIDSPLGIDLTTFYQNSVVSLDIVVRPRGTGKVIAQIEAKP